MFQKLKKQKRYDWHEEQQMKSSKKDIRSSLRKQREKMDNIVWENN